MSRKDLVLTLHSLLTVPVGTTVAFALMSEYASLWAIVAFFGVVTVLNMVWVVLWEAWYEQGKFFNVVPYPQVLSIPTWFIVRCFRARGFFGPTSPFNQPITLRNWNRFSTAITRRFDLVFWILNFTLWALIYLTITRWP